MSVLVAMLAFARNSGSLGWREEVIIGTGAPLYRLSTSSNLSNPKRRVGIRCEEMVREETVGVLWTREEGLYCNKFPSYNLKT